jgi:hypothetical protein
MAVTAWTFPGSVRQTAGNAFSNLNNILADDGNLAISASSGINCRIKLEDFSFDLPDDATIDGIEVEYETQVSSGTRNLQDFAAIKGGTVQTVAYADQSATTTLTVKTIGGATDLWNTTWTPADIEANGTSGFGIDIFIDGLDFSHNHRFDYVKVRIYYTASGGATYTLTGDAGSFTLTGIATGLKAARKLTADAASYTLTGVDVSLTYTPIGGPDYTLTANAASFALTGIDAGLKAGRKLTAAQATFALTGNATGLLAGRKLTAAAASFTLTGNNVNFGRTYALAAETAAYTFTGMNASLSYSGQGLWTPVSPAGGTWTPATPAGGTWTPV